MSTQNYHDENVRPARSSSLLGAKSLAPSVSSAALNNHVVKPGLAANAALARRGTGRTALGDISNRAVQPVDNNSNIVKKPVRLSV